MIATTTIWRWMVRKDGSSYVQTRYIGQRCDWAAGGVYEQLGMVIPVG